jgi:hypothetical protein
MVCSNPSKLLNKLTVHAVPVPRFYKILFEFSTRYRINFLKFALKFQFLNIYQTFQYGKVHAVKNYELQP